jgi:hypothetical protein
LPENLSARLRDGVFAVNTAAGLREAAPYAPLFGYRKANVG